MRKLLVTSFSVVFVHFGFHSGFDLELEQNSDDFLGLVVTWSFSVQGKAKILVPRLLDTMKLHCVQCEQRKNTGRKPSINPVLYLYFDNL